MIAAIEWIPTGRANPSPSKYEYSRAEQEFLSRVQAGDLDQDGDNADDVDDNNVENSDGSGKEESGDDEEWEDMEEEGEGSGKTKVELPKVDLASLPADLNMDDYSDDEDGDKEKDVGGLLVGKVRTRLWPHFSIISCQQRLSARCLMASFFILTC
mmetsp:Transcript_25603/g.46305  ORF Transcript_25603/g.46305 Transcript_25603/m.46305 type:complete len:156 (+) Transcript_25603:3-470(+)